MGNIDERVRRLVHPESCSLLLNTFQSAAAGTLKYRCGTNNRGGEQVVSKVKPALFQQLQVCPFARALFLSEELYT